MGEVVVANATPIWVGVAGNRVSYGRALLLDFIAFISRLKYWGVGQYYDEVVESLGVLF